MQRLLTPVKHFLLMLLVHICFQYHLLTLSLSLTPDNLNLLKSIIRSICEDFDMLKDFAYKRMVKSYSSHFSDVVYEVILNMFQWLLIPYNQTSVVNGYERNKHYAIISQDVRSKSFQEPILHHSL